LAARSPRTTFAGIASANATVELEPI
jgi:hypothetical protein